MARVVVLGASLAGLHTALALSRHGHRVTVLERDPPPPAELTTWARPGTPQLWQSHSFLGRYVELLRAHTPDLLDRLLDAGARVTVLQEHLPPPVTDRARRPADDDLTVLGCRRPVLDAVVHRYVVEQPGVTVETGVSVRGLDLAPGPVPAVRGVLTDAGPRPADLVVDASGRRSKVSRLLADAGVAVVDGDEAPCGNVYYTRHYRALPGAEPQTYVVGFVEGAMLDALAYVAFPGEGDTHTVSVQVEDDDPELRVIRDESAFEAAVRALPSFAPRVDPARAEPISPVYVMAGLRNRLRRLVVDGRPAVTGLQFVGDSLCVTNPTFGRGSGHAVTLAWRVAELLDGRTGEELAFAVDEVVDREVAPYFRNALARDTLMRARWRRVIYDEPERLDPDLAAAGEAWERAFFTGLADRDVWSAVTRTSMLMRTPESTLGDPLVARRIAEATARGLPAMPPVPTRADVLAAIRADAGLSAVG